MTNLDRILTQGSVTFAAEGGSYTLVYEPNEDTELEHRTAAVLFRRKSTSACLDALSDYLFHDERDNLDIPTTFFDPEYTPDPDDYAFYHL